MLKLLKTPGTGV